MVAINFTMFTIKVENGTKRQTIRSATRVKAGDALQLYSGQRTKDCRKLKDAVCKSVETVVLTETYVRRANGLILTGTGLEEFAKQDGFINYFHMWDFFGKRADANGEYHGKLIKW